MNEAEVTTRPTAIAAPSITCQASLPFYVPWIGEVDATRVKLAAFYL